MNRLSNKAKPYVIRASEIHRAGQFSLCLAGPEVLGKGSGSCMGSQANLLLGGAAFAWGCCLPQEATRVREGTPILDPHSTAGREEV